MRRFVLSIIGVCAALYIHAQDTVAIGRAISMIHHVQEKSLEKPISFDLRYTYSNEHTPGTLLDSMEGKIEMNGENYRCLLDSTETIRNSKYNIILFKQDKVMYLASNNNAGAAAPTDPLQTLRTFLEGAGKSACTFSHDRKNTIINIIFPAGGPCKQLSITIDTVAQRLIAMQYILKTSMLMSEDVQQETPEGYEEYAQVKASFYNYREMPADNSRFDEKAFFYKDGAAFKVMPAYEDYSIFVGTPGL